MDLTYAECLDYLTTFFKMRAEREFDIFKAFCAYNAESTQVATHGKRDDFNRYMAEIRRRTLPKTADPDEDLDPEEQFRRANIGK
jgi:hypothetical protein